MFELANMQTECISTRTDTGTALAHAEILHGGGNSLPCGIARTAPWTRLAEGKCFANL